MMNGHPVSQTPRIAIGMPSHDEIKAETAFSLAMLAGRLGWRHIPIFPCNARNSNAAAGRNRCVEEAQKAEADYLFFMDSDMVVPPEAVEILLSRQKDIVGALYRRRGPPYDLMGVTLKPGAVEVAGGVYEMAAIPTGCMLIDMKVFAALEKPYFRHRVRAGEEVEDTEDYVFCDMARAAGFAVWADIDLSAHVDHIGIRRLKAAHVPLDGAPPLMSHDPATGETKLVA